MKLFRKALFLSLVVLLSMSLVKPAGASEIKSKLVYENEEISDLNVLYNRAIMNESEDKKFKGKGIRGLEVASNTKGNEKIKVKELETIQLLSVKEEGNSTVEEYAKTTFIVEENTNNNLIIMSTQSGNKTESTWDSSLGVRAYSTIYYSRTVIGGISRAKLTSVSGGWAISDSQISLSNRKLVMGTSGWPAGHQSVTHNLSSNSWVYNAPSSWDYVSTEAGNSIGATTTVTLKRGTSTWTLTHNNNL